MVVGGIVSTVLARNFFESEKKVTHRIDVNHGVDHPQFERTISAFLGPPLIGGNEVTLFHNGAEIFPAMLEAIEGARRTITFENFVFTNGRIARRFFAALTEKARSGVKVHFLQDAVGCDCHRSPAMDALREAGAHVEIFRYIHLRFNERTHRKLLIIDGEHGFIGGVGISDAWDGHGDHPDIWRDTQYHVRGPVAAQMQQAFLDNWMQTRGEVLQGEEYFPELHPVGGLKCQAFQSSSSEGADSARLLFLFSMAAARKSIRIANAYFIPDDLSVSTIVEARQRGVEVDVITAGPHTDQPTVRLVGRSRWEPMLEAGVRFYEFQPARFHCKNMIIDEAWATVGSCNFDNRSLRLNDEANLNILSEPFAKDHAEVFERDKSRSKEIKYDMWRGRPMSEKIQGRLGCLLRSQI